MRKSATCGAMAAAGRGHVRGERGGAAPLRQSRDMPCRYCDRRKRCHRSIKLDRLSKHGAV